MNSLYILDVFASSFNGVKLLRLSTLYQLFFIILSANSLRFFCPHFSQELLFIHIILLIFANNSLVILLFYTFRC